MKGKTIKYHSTNGRSPVVSFSKALLKGIAPDGGLYMPDYFPEISSEQLDSLKGKEYFEIASLILNEFISDEISSSDILNLCRDAYNFSIPIEKVSQRKYILRLDQGPTASFKDFAARMMGRLMQYFLSANEEYLTILTATSGDTGSAVANAFYGMKNINVVILFPENEVTAMQRKQITTLGNNIKVIAIDGKFDDCQNLVKRIFLDPGLQNIALSSANSINIGRLLPQSIYYFYAWSRLSTGTNDKAIFSVPSGNFGNLMGGLISYKMGLPIEKFIIATNENDEVPEFLHSGIYKPIIPSRNCISSAMNVGHPSNLPRIISLFDGMMEQSGKLITVPDMEKMREVLFGLSISEESTIKTISDTYLENGVLLEPHGAIAWRGVEEHSRDKDINEKTQLYISLETAHPAKFPEEIKKIIGIDPPLPPSLTGIGDKKESYLKFDNDYSKLKDFIVKYYGSGQTF